MMRYFAGFLEFLLFLVKPEESIVMMTDNQERSSGKQVVSAGIIKTVFWIAISIATGLLLSKL